MVNQYNKLYDVVLMCYKNTGTNNTRETTLCLTLSLDYRTHQLLHPITRTRNVGMLCEWPKLISYLHWKKACHQKGSKVVIWHCFCCITSFLMWKFSSVRVNFLNMNYIFYSVPLFESNRTFCFSFLVIWLKIYIPTSNKI